MSRVGIIGVAIAVVLVAAGSFWLGRQSRPGHVQEQQIEASGPVRAQGNKTARIQEGQAPSGISKGAGGTQSHQLTPQQKRLVAAGFSATRVHSIALTHP